MPDADGNLKGIAVPADAWERIFGPTETTEARPLIVVVLCGGGIDRRLAKQASNLLVRMGHRRAEFYVFPC